MFKVIQSFFGIAAVYAGQPLVEVLLLASILFIIGERVIPLLYSKGKETKTKALELELERTMIKILYILKRIT